MSNGHKTPLDTINKKGKDIKRKTKKAGKKLTYKTQKLGKDIRSSVIETKASIESNMNRWYSVCWLYHKSGWSAEDNLIFEIANDMHISTGVLQMQGEVFAYVYCSKDEVDRLKKKLGSDYAYGEVDKDDVWLIQKSCGPIERACKNINSVKKGIKHKS